MEHSPLISIVIPAYNIEKYIVECVDSVLRQSFRNYELIIVNDGSTDNTTSLLSELEKKDSKINVVNKKNEGVSFARYDGLKISKGEYVMFVDGDDWLSDDCLLKVSAVIEQYSPDVICFGENTCDIQNNYIETRLPYRYGLYNKMDIEKELYPFLISSSDGTYFTPSLIEKCFKRDLCGKYMLAHKDATIGEDGAIVIPCVYHAISLYMMEECLYYYRFNNASVTKGKKVFNWFSPEIINKHIEQYVDISKFDFAAQLNRKIVHDIFCVVVTRFYQNIPYKEIIVDIKKNISNPYYHNAILNALFPRSNSHSFMKNSLKYRWYLLIYLYSRIK